MPNGLIGHQQLNPWPYWMTTTATTTTAVWDNWNVGRTFTGYGQTSAQAWQFWTSNVTLSAADTVAMTDGVARALGSRNFHGLAPAPIPERQRRIYETRRHALAVRERVAQRRAEKLLLEHLDDDQAQEWRLSKTFHIETADGQRRYLIKRGLAGNVHLVQGIVPGRLPNTIRARPGNRFCAHVYHPDGSVPLEDNVLTQKLLLESDEDAFLRMANVS